MSAAPDRRGGLGAAILTAATLLVGGEAAAQPAEALQTLEEALRALNRGDGAAAERIVQEARPLVSEIAAGLETFRARSGEVVEVCDSSLAVLEMARGAATAAHEKVSSELSQARARLDAAQDGRSDAEAEMAKLRSEIAQARRAMAQHRAKLEELNKWWWVPGYGMFLGIRELVDKDSNRINSLHRDLQTKNRLFASADREASTADHLAHLAASAESRAVAQEMALKALRDRLHARLAALRELDDYAQDANLFWDEVASTLEISVTGSMDLFENEAQRLLAEAESKRTAPELLDASTANYFRDALTELSKQIRTGDLKARVDAQDCQVADRPKEWVGAIETCEELPRYPYYRFTDAASCQFEYIDPPGCPPDPKRVVTPISERGPLDFLAAQPAAAGLARNWIGARRCVSDSLVYLGRADDWLSCSSACVREAKCAIWTWQANDRPLPGRRGECWGAPEGPTKEMVFSPPDSPGFVSGPCPTCAIHSIGDQ